MKRYFKNADPTILRLAAIFAVSFIAMAILNPKIFLSGNYIQSMAFLFPEYGVLALAMMLAMMSGGIDLSIIATANFSGILGVLFLIRFFPVNAPVSVAALYLIATVLICVFVGACCGAFIGTLISRVGIPPILATLGGADLIMGASLVLTKGSAVKGIPAILSRIGNHILFGVLPVTVLVYATLAVIIWFLIKKRPYGVKLCMVGSNPVAARFSGIKNKTVLLHTYMISGMLSAFSGLLLISRTNSARADYGSSYIMQAIIIAVLGGTNPNGGFGTVGGVTIAVFILQVLSSGFNMFSQISNFYRSIIWGAVLLAAMCYNHISENAKYKKLAHLSAMKDDSE